MVESPMTTRPLAAWPQPLPVREWMRRPVATMRSDALVSAAMRLMRSNGVRHLPVTDAGGRLIGIVTDRDLRQVVFSPVLQALGGEAERTLGDMTVGEAMTWGVLSVRPTTDLREAARLMYERKVGAVPVVEDDRVVGILTETDMLQALECILQLRPQALGVEVLLHPREKCFNSFGIIG